MHVRTYIRLCVCVSVCERLIPSQCSIVPQTAAVIYVKILSFPSFPSITFVVPHFSLSHLGSTHPSSHPFLPPPFPYCETVSIFCSFSPRVTLPRFSTSVCFSACLFFLPRCRRVLISISSTYTFLSLCCHPSVLCIRLTLSFSAFVSCPPPSWTYTRSCKKARKKKRQLILQPLSHLLYLSLPFFPSSGLK